MDIQTACENVAGIASKKYGDLRRIVAEGLGEQDQREAILDILHDIALYDSAMPTEIEVYSIRLARTVANNNIELHALHNGLSGHAQKARAIKQLLVALDAWRNAR